jgi:HEPN domain-containing protein
MEGREMGERSLDWTKQAEADYRHARNSRSMGDCDWACFAAHQAAERAVDAGAPTDLYTSDEADNAIAITGEIIEFCKGLLGR